MKLHFVDTMDQVLAVALESALPIVEIPAEAAQPMAPPLSSTEGPAARQ
jgi:hypothetical protein